MATRNGARWLDRQIDSVLAQEEVDVRLVVRDDDSSDDTLRILQARAASETRISLLDDHVASGSASGNFFALVGNVALADSFDYVAFCDQDDVWMPDKLARAVRLLRSSSSGGYSAPTIATWKDGRTRTLRQSNRIRKADYLFEGAGQGCTFVLDAATFRGFQDQLRRQETLMPRLHYHDWSLYAWTRTAHIRWVFDDEPAIHYWQHHGNDTGARSSNAGLMRRLRLIREGWYRAQVDAIVEFVLGANEFDEAAVAWTRLSSRSAGSSWSARIRRIHFVARNGRRRLLDRAILVIAVALGHL